MSFNVLAIAVDRMLYAKSAIAYHYWQKRMFCMIIAVWTLAIVCSFPSAIVFSVDQVSEGDEYQCNTNEFFRPSSQNLSKFGISFFREHKMSTGEMTLLMFSAVFMFWLPLIGIVIVYGLICRLVSRSLHNSHSPTTSMNGKHESRPLGRKTYRVSAKARKMASKVIIPYILCWTPYNCVFFWILLDHRSYQEHVDILGSATLLLAVANACVNPFLYGEMER